MKPMKAAKITQFLSPVMNLFGESPIAYSFPTKNDRTVKKVLHPRRVNMDQLNHHRLLPFLKQQIEEDKGLVLKEKEIAFIGRSNVGKSSMINSIMDSPKVCRVAKKPGTTRELHFHGLVPGKGVLVDVPGYGFAHMNQRQRQYWLGTVYDYLKLSSRVSKIYFVINASHGAMKIDLDLMRKIDPLSLQYQIVFTKVDLLPEDQIWRRALALGQQLRKFEFRNLSPVLLAVSSKTGFGIEQLKQSVIYSLQNTTQRNIDGKEQLLLDFLDTRRVQRQKSEAQHKHLVRDHELKRLFYASKYSRYLQ